jgi:hypothetical protein
MFGENLADQRRQPMPGKHGDLLETSAALSELACRRAVPV